MRRGVELDDAVAERDQPLVVRRDDDGHGAGQLGESAGDSGRTLLVEMRCRLVEQQQPPPGREGARERETADLAGRKRRLLAELRVEPGRKRGDDRQRRRPAEGREQLVVSPLARRVEGVAEPARR